MLLCDLEGVAPDLDETGTGKVFQEFAVWLEPELDII